VHDNNNNKKEKDTFSQIQDEEVTRFSMEQNTLKMEISAAKSHPAKVTLLVGPKKLVGFSWTLLKPITTVGRSRELSDIVIEYENLSRAHFQFIKRADRFYIKDLKSTNKTYKNDEMLEASTEYPVFNNDLIRASDVIFKFLKQGSIESLSTKSFLDKAYKDSLTSAGNRQFFKLKIQELFNESKELCLILFDVDNFKSINDTYGHLAGDYVLKSIVGVVQETIRDRDALFRYGGDEFCILTASSLDIGTHIMERIVQNLDKHSFVFQDHKIQASISLGLTNKQDQDQKWQDMYRRADVNCYKSKRNKKKK